MRLSFGDFIYMLFYFFLLRPLLTVWQKTKPKENQKKRKKPHCDQCQALKLWAYLCAQTGKYLKWKQAYVEFFNAALTSYKRRKQFVVVYKRIFVHL